MIRTQEKIAQDVAKVYSVITAKKPENGKGRAAIVAETKLSIAVVEDSIKRLRAEGKIDLYGSTKAAVYVRA